MRKNLGKNLDGKNNQPFSANEISSNSQFWLPDSKQKPMRAEDYFEELLKPASGYRSPVSVQDKFLLKLRQKMMYLSGTNELLVPNTGNHSVPLNWQAIVTYLYEAGTIKEPRFQFEPLFNDEPKIHSFRLMAASSESLTDGRSDSMNGGYSRGISQDINEAFSKVVGEFLERYPLRIYRHKELARASVGDLKKEGRHFLNPFLAAGFSEEQKKKFPNRRFDENSIFHWVKGKSLTTGKGAFIPAQMVFWNYRLAADEPFIQQPITNGAGGMFTLTEAILAGLYELIQRDAFFIHWFNKIAPARIELDSVDDEEFKKIFADLKKYRLRLEILDITSDFGIPAFVSILLSDSDNGPAISVGGGCGPNASKAIIRALTESLGVHHWLRQNDAPYPSLPENYEPFSMRLGQRERLLIWGNEVMKPRFEFFISGQKVSFEEKYGGQTPKNLNPEQELNKLVERFRQKGPPYEIFYYEAKHAILETLGYHSVSVSVPALIPLYLDETCAPLNAERIQSACSALGYKPVETLNPWPHPFP